MAWLKRLGGLLAFLVIWELAARSGLVPAQYLPPLAVIGEALMRLAASPAFLTQLVTTWGRLAIGLALAILIGLGLAITAGRSALLRRALEPLTEMLRALPPPALVPLMIFVVGVGPGLFYFIIVFGSMWPIYINAANALAVAEPAQIQTARSFGYSDTEILLKVRVPAALPEFMTGIRIAAGISLLATIAAEMLAGANGLGYLLYNAGFSLLIPDMYAIMFVIGLSGIVLNALVGVVRYALVGWQIRWAALGDVT